MKFVFLLFISFLLVNPIVAQDKKMSTQDRLKELARIKREYDEQKKKEWDAYLVRVEESKIAKQQKRHADSIEKAKLKVSEVKDDGAGLLKCDTQVLPLFKVKNLTTGLEEEIPYNNYIQKHVARKFIYPEFAMDHNLQGRVMVHFFIDLEGKAHVVEANGPKNGLVLEEEATRIIKSLPTAIPATCDGKPVKVMFAIPVTFRLED